MGRSTGGWSAPRSLRFSARRLPRRSAALRRGPPRPLPRTSFARLRRRPPVRRALGAHHPLQPRAQAQEWALDDAVRSSAAPATRTTFHRESSRERVDDRELKWVHVVGKRGRRRVAGSTCQIEQRRRRCGLDVTTKSHRSLRQNSSASEAALEAHAISRFSIGTTARRLARQLVAPGVHPSAAARRIE